MKTLLTLFLLASLTATTQPLSLSALKTENKTNPLGIATTTPKFSWQLTSTQKDVLQTAYRVLVSDNPKLIAGNIWDSKKIISSQSLLINFNGRKLNSTKKYYWKVMAWDNKNNVSKWSEPATFQMGLLSPADWKGAKWIALEKLEDSLKIIAGYENRGPRGLTMVKNELPLLRKSFIINKPVKSATIFICGLGQFELSINGKKTGDHFLDPGWTQFDKEAQYVSFDVTNQLRQGENALGVMLGNGFYFIPRQRYRKLTAAFGFPKMISSLVIEFADGTIKNIISDETWKTHASPITYSSIFGGEDYDANREQVGWNTSAFNDKHWKKVLIVDGPPKLISQMQEPLKLLAQFSAKKITKVKDSAYVYDLLQNASGIVSISVSGKKGDTIRLIPGELLNSNGTVSQRSSGGPFHFEYILKGGGLETWQPRFTYYGFRYVQVERGVPKGKDNPHHLPLIVDLKVLHNRNAASKIGDFSCSNELFNKTNELIDWAVKSNFQSVITDCPHREKLGWLEQVHLMGSSIRYNYDAVNLFKKTINDMMVAQTPEGLIPEISPEYVKFEWGDGMFRDSPEWGSNGIILPWYVYQWYGETEVLKEAYPMMQKYIAYLKSKANDNILSQGLGDWYDLGPKPPGVSQRTPMGVTGTAIYFYDLKIMNKVASLLGKANDADQYEALAKQVKESFNRKFFNQKTKQYATGSQTANAMAVYMQLVEPENKEAVIDNIVKDLRANKNALTAGDIGYRYLLRVLEDEGYSDVIYDMNSRSDVPGYGYQLQQGATALTESWQALPANSNNHLMLGHLMEWFYSGIGGIKQEANSIAFKSIIIKPEPVGNLSWAKTTYNSPYGTISSLWKRQSNSFNLEVIIPANTTATVYLPGDKQGIKIGSGTHTFSSGQKDKTTVPFNEMQKIYELIKTPHKYGMVVVPENDSLKIDCPSVFRKNNKWYMTYLQFDGRGYETWLAESNDLLNWKTKGRLLSNTSDTLGWDAHQKAGYIALQDHEWGGSYELQKHDNKYWMSYFGGNARGYEQGLLSLGMAYTSKDPVSVHEWQRVSKPIMMSTDSDVRWWENKKQFKSTVIWDRRKATGYPFVMYYNANGDSASNNVRTRWFERIGMNVSNDMINWKRFGTETVVQHPIGITGDPVIQKIGDIWVMFYFGAFWKDRKGAFNRFACSYNLVNWTDWTGDNLVESSEPYDELYAHKSFVVNYKGVVYHFYCAVNKKEQRGIAVATSKDLGKSTLSFIKSEK